MSQSTFKGKLMALPQMVASIDNAPMLWIRYDWLQKLGLQPPKTMEDVFKISEAFTRRDPDGNGKDDTFGLGVEKSLFGSGFGDLQGFFNGYHAYPGDYIKDSSGKLTGGPSQPEMKAALAKLAELYKAGQIDKEFAVKDTSKVAESVASEKIGMLYGQHWLPFWPLQDLRTKNNKADWRPYPIVSIDSTPAMAFTGLSVGQFFVVKKDMKNPEAVVKLMNYFLSKDLAFSSDYDISYHGGQQKESNFIDDVYDYAIVSSWYARQNIYIYQGMDEYYKNKDASKLNPWTKTNAENIDKYLAGDQSMWSTYMWSGPTGAFSVINQYDQTKLLRDPLFYGAPTPTMVSKGSTINKMMFETFTKIIMGAAHIEEFDKYVENNKKAGGDDIEKEVNEWAASVK